MNILFFNSRKIVKRVYNYQQFSVFGKIKDFLSSKRKENVEDKPKDNLIVIDEGLTKYNHTKKKIKEEVIDNETKKLKGKVKKVLKPKKINPEEERLLKEKKEIFSGLDIKTKLKRKQMSAVSKEESNYK